MQPPSFNPQNPKQRAYEDLRYRIITHDLKPGEQLIESALMTHYVIGRSPLREVLLDLQRDALIYRVPRSGTFVSALDVHEVRQALEIRLSLEAFAAKLAAERISTSEQTRLKRILQRVDVLRKQEGEDLDALTHCEFDFHRTVYNATENPKLSHMLHELHGISARFWHYLVFSRQEILEQFDDLAAVYRAIEQKDPHRAREKMALHIQHTIDKVRGKIV